MPRLAVAGSVLVLLTAACQGVVADTTSTTAAALPATTLPLTTTTVGPPQPIGGGEVAIGLDQEPRTLNPLVEGGNNFVVSVIGNAYFTGAWRLDPDLGRIPDVVLDLPSVSNGGVAVDADGTVTVRYDIRPEAVWADGVPISGADFAFTYEIIMADDAPVAVARQPYEAIVAESIVVGAKTFGFQLREPTVSFEALFPVIVPRHDVDGRDFAQDFNERPWVSGGPFVFDEWVPGSHLRVVRNPSYWRTDSETGQSLPHLDAVVFRFTPEMTAMVQAFRDREIDLIEPPPHPGTIRALQTTDGVGVVARPGSVWEHLAFSFSENSLTRNPRSYNAHLEYRRAVAHVVDRYAIAYEINEGFVGPMSSYLDAYGPGISGAAWERYDHDPERARAYIADLCVKDGVDCEAEPPTAVITTTAGGSIRERVADLLENMLPEAGIQVVLELEPSTIFFGTTLDSGSWDLAVWAWVGLPGLTGAVAGHGLFDPAGPPPIGENYYRWGTPAVTTGDAPFRQGPSLVRNEHTARAGEVLREMRNSVDSVDITRLVGEMEAILADQVVIIPLFSRPWVTAWWSDRLGGVAPNATMSGVTWNIAEWHRFGSQ